MGNTNIGFRNTQKVVKGNKDPSDGNYKKDQTGIEFFFPFFSAKFPVGPIFPILWHLRMCHANVFFLPIEMKKNRLVLVLVLNLMHSIVFLFSFCG